MNNRNYYTIALALLGLAKLVLNSFNIDFTNSQMNDIANAAATLITVGGVLMTHIKKKAPAPVEPVQPAEPAQAAQPVQPVAPVQPAPEAPQKEANK